MISGMIKKIIPYNLRLYNSLVKGRIAQLRYREERILEIITMTGDDSLITDLEKCSTDNLAKIWRLLSTGCDFKTAWKNKDRTSQEIMLLVLAKQGGIMQNE